MSSFNRAQSRKRWITPRELQVLRLKCDGLQNKQIAYRMGISERTVKAYAQCILYISGCKTQAHLGAWAQRQGLLLKDSTEVLSPAVTELREYAA